MWVRGGAILKDDYLLAREIRDHQLRYKSFSNAKAKGFKMLDQFPGVRRFFEHTPRKEMLPERAERMISGIGMLGDIVFYKTKKHDHI